MGESSCNNMHESSNWQTLLLMALGLGVAGMVGLRAMSNKVVNAQMVYLRWLMTQNKFPSTTTGASSLLTENRMLNQLMSYVKDPINRALLVVDGPVGIGKGVLFKRLGHMLTEGRMPMRFLYHHTGLAIPCVVVKLTASDKPWHRVHEKLAGGILTLNETVIRIALTKMKKLPFRPVVIIDEIQKLFSGPNLDLNSENQDFVFFWQQMAEEGLATVVVITSEQSVYWRLRGMPTLDDDSRLKLITLPEPATEEIYHFLSHENISSRLIAKGRPPLREDEMKYYSENIRDYRTIEGFLSPEERRMDLIDYIDYLIEIQRLVIEEFMEDNSTDREVVLKVMKDLLTAEKAEIERKEGQLVVFKKLVDANILRRKQIDVYTWYRSIVRAGAIKYIS